MTVTIGKFRAGMWVFAMTVTLLVAGLYQMTGQRSTSAFMEALPGIIAAGVTVLSVYCAGVRLHLRVGLIAAALLLGNFAFLDAGRYPGVNPDFYLMALQSVIFAASVYFLPRKRWGYLAGMAFLVAFTLVGFARWPYELTTPAIDWRGIITSAIGAIGAIAFLFYARKSAPNQLYWWGILVWGALNLVLAGDRLLMTLAPAALLGGWLIDNVDHRKAVRIVSSGILLALRLVPLFVTLLWLYTWWGARAGGIQIPLLMPLILLAILCLASWRATRYFKYTDRRVLIVALAAAAIALWQIMLTEPVRLQKQYPAQTATHPQTVTDDKNLEVIDVEYTPPVLQSSH